MAQSSIAEALHLLMKRDDVSAYRLSEDLHMPKSSIYALTHQETDKVSLSTLKALADYFKVDVSIFFNPETYVPPISLDADERTLLTMFRRLNPTGRMRSSEYVEGLCAQKKFLV